MALISKPSSNMRSTILPAKP